MPRKSVSSPSIRPTPAETSLVDIAGVTPTARQFEAGTTVFREGAPTFGIFRLVSGRVSLIRVTPGGTEVPMHHVQPGELFAEASLFSPRYHCDAVVTQDCTVLVYPKAKLARQFKENTDALWAFTAELAHRIQGLRTRLQTRQIRSAPERVLQSLRLRCDASGRWKPTGTLKQFAEEIGLTHEALYRAVARLEGEGSIIRSDNEIRLKLK